jgi:cytochrome c oxidase subunit 2
MKIIARTAASILLLASALTLQAAGGAQDGPKRIEVTASKFAFTPGELTLKKGQPVVLVLKSADVAHGLRFRELNLNVKADKGASTEMPFTPDKVGTFVGHCSVFCGSGHGEMALTLHVVD